jgi:hypothetical protein
MRRSVIARRRRFIVRVENEGLIGGVNSLRCGGRQGSAALAPPTTRRALDCLPRSGSEVVKELKLESRTDSKFDDRRPNGENSARVFAL